MRTPEEVRSIPNFPDYEVSSTGTVFSLKSGSRKELKANISKRTGYKMLTLCGGGSIKQCNVHSLVLQAFIGPRPEGKLCRHLDGNPLNNNLENLCYGTSSENAYDAIGHGTFPVGSKNGFSKLTEEQVAAMKEKLGRARHSELATEFNVSVHTIKLISRGLRWKHIEGANHRNICKNGHEYTPQNTRIEKTGRRRCLTCSRINNNKARMRRKDEWALAIPPE